MTKLLGEKTSNPFLINLDNFWKQFPKCLLRLTQKQKTEQMFQDEITGLPKSEPKPEPKHESTCVLSPARACARVPKHRQHTHTHTQRSHQQGMGQIENYGSDPDRLHFHSEVLQPTVQCTSVKNPLRAEQDQESQYPALILTPTLFPRSCGNPHLSLP